MHFAKNQLKQTVQNYRDFANQNNLQTRKNYMACRNKKYDFGSSAVSKLFQIMKMYRLECVFWAHANTVCLHITRSTKV